MKILDQPDAPGYYWWREQPYQPYYRWHLALVTKSVWDDELDCEFFNDLNHTRGKNNDMFYGEWVKVEIPEPG